MRYARFPVGFSMILLTCAALLSVGCGGTEAPPQEPTSVVEEAPDEAMLDETDPARELEEMQAMSEETRRQIEAIQAPANGDETHESKIDAARSEADSLHQALIDLIES
ncbi:MAG: hypothetical protein AAGF99_16385 [Bacteroidota bacterium]